MYTLKQIQELIQKKISSISFLRGPRELYEPVQYIMSLGGKRLRPALVLLSCNMFSEEIDHAVIPAIGMEVLHNFTLVHDDIMDNAPRRRGKASIHEKWDANTAILSGDAMMFISSQFIASCPRPYLADILTIYNETALMICEGQQLDMNFETMDTVTEQEYLEMIALKTSVLLAACLKIGAILGGAAIEDAETLYQFGKYIGLAFQLQDDLLDVYGDENVFGKKSGGDIVSNKKTYLLINALNTDNRLLKQTLKKEIFKTEFVEEQKIATVKGIYDELGVKKVTEEKINEFFSLAMNKLETLSVEKSHLHEMQKFAYQLLKRVS